MVVWFGSSVVVVWSWWRGDPGVHWIFYMYLVVVLLDGAHGVDDAELPRIRLAVPAGPNVEGSAACERQGARCWDVVGVVVVVGLTGLAGLAGRRPRPRALLCPPRVLRGAAQVAWQLYQWAALPEMAE